MTIDNGRFGPRSDQHSFRPRLTPSAPLLCFFLTVAVAKKFFIDHLAGSAKLRHILFSRKKTMKNAEMKVEGNILTIMVDLTKEFGPSS